VSKEWDNFSKKLLEMRERYEKLQMALFNTEVELALKSESQILEDAGKSRLSQAKFFPEDSVERAALENNARIYTLAADIARKK